MTFNSVQQVSLKQKEKGKDNIKGWAHAKHVPCVAQEDPTPPHYHIAPPPHHQKHSLSKECGELLSTVRCHLKQWNNKTRGENRNIIVEKISMCPWETVVMWLQAKDRMPSWSPPEVITEGMERWSPESQRDKDFLSLPSVSSFSVQNCGRIQFYCFKTHISDISSQ